MEEPTRKLGFVCVQNAGRSQMSAAFAERERDERNLGDHVAVVTGGTHPADSVHDEVVAVMDEVGIDVSNRTPRKVSTETVESCDVVATMGCSTLELDAERVEIRDWNLDDPHGPQVRKVQTYKSIIG